jgi:hypothetical protein
MNFEQQYQAQFAVIAEKTPIGSKVFGNDRIYTVTDYEICNGKHGVVGVDKQGNEKSLYDFEPISSDSQTCSRCGGSGRHSYNIRHGSVCYGCEGKGTVPKLPKAATKTMKLVVVTDKTPFKQGQEVKAKFINVSEKYEELIFMVEDKSGVGFKMRLSQIKKNCEEMK